MHPNCCMCAALGSRAAVHADDVRGDGRVHAGAGAVRRLLRLAGRHIDGGGGAVLRALRGGGDTGKKIRLESVVCSSRAITHKHD